MILLNYNQVNIMLFDKINTPRHCMCVYIYINVYVYIYTRLVLKGTLKCVIILFLEKKLI